MEAPSSLPTTNEENKQATSSQVDSSSEEVDIMESENSTPIVVQSLDLKQETKRQKILRQKKVTNHSSTLLITHPAQEAEQALKQTKRTAPKRTTTSVLSFHLF
jgi:hypothetical protein